MSLRKDLAPPGGIALSMADGSNPVVKVDAAGLNFIDVYTRSGLYQTPLPNAVGREAAGVIVEQRSAAAGLLSEATAASAPAAAAIPIVALTGLAGRLIAEAVDQGALTAA